MDNFMVVVHPRPSASMTTMSMTTTSPSTPQQCDLFIVHETSLWNIYIKKYLLKNYTWSPWWLPYVQAVFVNDISVGIYVLIHSFCGAEIQYSFGSTKILGPCCLIPMHPAIKPTSAMTEPTHTFKMGRNVVRRKWSSGVLSNEKKYKNSMGSFRNGLASVQE